MISIRIINSGATDGRPVLHVEGNYVYTLSALPKGRSFAFSQQDHAIIGHLETLTNGETPALLQMGTKETR